MQINNSLIPTAANLIADIQSGRGFHHRQPADAVQPIGEKAVMSSQQADEALLRLRMQETVYRQSMPSDLRSKKAMDAYQTLEQSAEREYVSSVLGVDEYV